MLPVQFQYEDITYRAEEESAKVLHVECQDYDLTYGKRIQILMCLCFNTSSNLSSFGGQLASFRQLKSYSKPRKELDLWFHWVAWSVLYLQGSKKITVQSACGSTVRATATRHRPTSLSLEQCEMDLFQYTGGGMYSCSPVSGSLSHLPLFLAP